MARLRSPEGCPWDREQTHASLCKPLIDETMELLDTIDRNDMDHMREELGDVLLQVVFHAQIARENGFFDFDAVAAEINEKLVRRHPHVFGDMTLGTSGEVLVEWEKIKEAEKQAKGQTATNGRLKELPPRTPALLFAHDTYKAIRKGHHTCRRIPTTETIAAEAESLDETSAGEALFRLAAACREAGIDPESALRRFTREVRSEIENES